MVWKDEFCPELEDPKQIVQKPTSPDIDELCDSVLAGTSYEPPTQEDSEESSPHQHVEVEEQGLPSNDGPIDNQLIPALPKSHPLREESNEEPPSQIERDVSLKLRGVSSKKYNNNFI